MNKAPWVVRLFRYKQDYEGSVMTGLFMESIVVAFMIGGIVGAITALHLASHNKEPVKVKSNRTYR